MLIIEDNPDHAELIRCAASAIPRSELSMADCLADACALISSIKFDAIISDLNLPDSDRHITVNRVKSAAPNTPLIVLTSDSINTDGSESIIAGAQDYIRKDELLTAPVERILNHAIERQRILNENVLLAEELHSKNMQLESAMSKIERAMRTKTDFLANMSHEIRTPLTSILGFTDIAMGTDGVLGDNEAKETLRLIKNNSSHLLTVINDILDVTKVESGSMQIELIPSSIKRVLETAVELLKPQALEKNLTIDLLISSEIPDILLFDPTRFTQIVLNLVSNAIKFSKAGIITIHARSAPSQSNSHWISIDIQDTGIGIKSEELNLIREFNAFTQANQSTTRRFGGSGLGLRISQGLAKLMGGSIEIESQYGAGSCFTLNFQADIVTAESLPKAQHEIITDGLNLDGLRVLIVDDSPDNRKLFAYHYSKYNAVVEYANHGGECIDRMTNTTLPQPDMVLMDIQMPVVDGFTAFAKLRELGCSIPIYATSASTAVADQRTALEFGFTGFISKPIDPAQLLKIGVEIQSRISKPAA
ncbi:MAG: response regulator [Phycisphaerales bacterium]